MSWNNFFEVLISHFYILYPFVTQLLTLLRNSALKTMQKYTVKTFACGRSHVQAMTMMNVAALTGHLERGIAAGGQTGLVARDAPIHAAILLLLPVHHPQEEERPSRQQDAMRPGIRRWSTHRLSVFEPFDCRLRLALRSAVQGHWFVFRYYHVGRVLRDPRSSVLTCKQNIRATVTDVRVFLVMRANFGNTFTEPLLSNAHMCVSLIIWVSKAV